MERERTKRREASAAGVLCDKRMIRNDTRSGQKNRIEDERSEDENAEMDLWNGWKKKLIRNGYSIGVASFAE